MGDIMKKVLSLVGFLIIIFSVSTKIVGSQSVFEWELTEIDVPYGSSLEKYINLVRKGIKLKAGLSDPDFYIDNEGVNYTYQHLIDTTILKTYYLYYSATSPKYKVTDTRKVFFHIVDVTPPKVSSSTPIYLLLGDKKPNYLKYLLYSDDTAPVEDITVSINDVSVDMNNIGIYDVIYTLTDNYGNQTIHLEKVYVEDRIKPVIKKIAGEKYIIGRPFNIYNFFVVTDNYDNDLKLEYTLLDSLTNEGEVEVTLTAVDSSGNKTTLNSFIEVIKDRPPVVVSSNSYYLLIGEKKPNYKDFLIYEDDLTLTKDIVIIIDDSGINYNKIGVYEVIFKLIDNSGNTTIHKEYVYIEDLISPIIEKIKEASFMENTIFNIYDYFIVTDNYDTNIELFYEIEGDLSQIGRANINLWAVDSSGNKTELYSYIDVVVNNNLQLNLIIDYLELSVGGEEIDLNAYLDLTKTDLEVLDNLIISESIDYEKVGKYDVIYSFTNDYNELNKTLIVYITDKISPEIFVENKYVNQYDNVDLLFEVEVKDNYSNADDIRLRIFNTNLNTQVCGTYFITYEAVDENGNHAYKTISVFVVSEIKGIKGYYIYLWVGVVLLLVISSGLVFYLFKKKKNKTKFLQ